MAYTNWVDFNKTKPNKNTDIDIDNTYLFDIEITQGLNKGKRIVAPFHYISGDINDWHIPYTTYTLKQVMGEVIFHYWMHYPLPNI